MTFYQITAGSEFNAEHLMSNFRHVRHGHLLPLGGLSLRHTNSSYSLGDATYRYDLVSISSLHIYGSVPLAGTESVRDLSASSFVPPFVMVRIKQVYTATVYYNVNVPAFGWEKTYDGSAAEQLYSNRVVAQFGNRGTYYGPTAPSSNIASTTSDIYRIYDGGGDARDYYSFYTLDSVMHDSTNSRAYISSRGAPISCTKFAIEDRTEYNFIGSLTTITLYVQSAYYWTRQA